MLKLLVVLFFAFPFFWMISTAFKTLSETLQYPPKMLPGSLRWENFVYVFQKISIGTYLKNSIIVAVAVVLLQYLIIVPAAYSLSRYQYKMKPIVFGLVLMGLMIPQQITFLPVYFMFCKMHIVNSYVALVIPFISNPFGIFLLRQYFMQVPQEVIEAAKLDDASNVKIMFKIMMPMAKPALITVGLLMFISNWNSYFWPLIMTSSDSLRTLPIGIALLKDADAMVRWNYIMAGNLILVLPILGIYIIASKKIRNAFVYSGIK
jgi:sn-glycerol 3-phosphate transport system permease protein